MLEPSHDEALQRVLARLVEKKDLEPVNLCMTSSSSLKYLTIGLNVPPKSFPALKKAVRKAVSKTVPESPDRLDVAITNGAEEYSLRLKSLADIAHPQREMVIKHEWTLEKVRHWITANAPDEVEVLAADTIKVKDRSAKGKRSSRNHILLRIGVPARQDQNNGHSGNGKNLRADLNRFAGQFKEEVGIPLLVEILPVTESAREILRSRLSKSIVTMEDIPSLQSLASDLRRQAPARAIPEEDMSERNWFRIDDEKTLKPEDLILLEPSRKSLIVHVALPDITGRPDNGNCNGNGIQKEEPMTPSQEPGYFAANEPRIAWVIDFVIKGDRITPRTEPEERSRPYRAMVCCRREYTLRSHIAHAEPGFEDLRRALRAMTNYKVVTQLMERTALAIGAFFERNGDPFLMWRKKLPGSLENDASLRDLLCLELASAGVVVNQDDFATPMGIARLMQRALEAGALDSLSALATALRGNPVVCMNESGSCSIKPEHGVLQQVNQWLLAARIDGRLDARPSFRNVETQRMFSRLEIWNYLKQWEIERHTAQFLKMLIKNLKYQGNELDVRVTQCGEGEVLCESPRLKRWGFISSDRRFQTGTRLKVFLGPFHLDKGRYEFILKGKEQELPAPSPAVWPEDMVLRTADSGGSGPASS